MDIKALLINISAILLVVLSIFELSFTETFAFTEIFWEQLSWLPHYWLALFEYCAGGVLILVGMRINKELTSKFLETSARIGLSFMFIGASIFKIQDPKSFAFLTAQYQFLPQISLNIFSLFLPVLELIVGVLLLVTNKTRENSTLILGMMLMFIIALIWAVAKNLGITCGCFELTGAMDKNAAWISLIRDIVLLPVLFWLSFIPSNNYIWAIWKR